MGTWTGNVDFNLSDLAGGLFKNYGYLDEFTVTATIRVNHQEATNHHPGDYEAFVDGEVNFAGGVPEKIRDCEKMEKIITRWVDNHPDKLAEMADAQGLLTPPNSV